MKFILCTGDSHTCGQYADGYDTWVMESLGYNIWGKGFTGWNPYRRDYVNIVRNYVVDHTNSKVEIMDITGWGKEYARFRKIEQPVVIKGGCDALLLQVAEKTTEATLGIYLDGKHYRSKKLYAEVTRYGLWSYTFILIPCSGVKEVKLVAESGAVYIGGCERWSGEYAVVNCGVGSCTARRYKDECLPELITEFPNKIFLAEVHTINEWAKGHTVEEYREALSEMLRIMKENSELTMAITVSPILTTEPLAHTKDFYKKFVDAAYDVIEKADVPMVDAHKAFAERITGRTTEELLGTMYGDKLHPRQPGYTLYAEVIIEKLKGVL